VVIKIGGVQPSFKERIVMVDTNTILRVLGLLRQAELALGAEQLPAIQMAELAPGIVAVAEEGDEEIPCRIFFDGAIYRHHTPISD
jgi:hypothetical protein